MSERWDGVDRQLVARAVAVMGLVALVIDHFGTGEGGAVFGLGALFVGIAVVLIPEDGRKPTS